uniref:Putative farnesoic acid o-methyltransferase n=1 Tax=Triatoma infestans TaxID=30076 RepID=A0A023F6M8_TRIIF
MHDAETYHKFTLLSCAGAKEVLIYVKDKLTWNENENILDIGCGTGDITVNVITEYVPSDSKIIGADISDEMIKFAENLHSHPRITFKRMDILDDNLWTSWNKGQFSKIMNFYLMQRIKDSRKAYSNMYNLIQPGDEVLMMFPIKQDLDKIGPYLARMSKYSKYAEELSKITVHFTPREDHVSYNCDLLESLGFDLILCKEKVVSCEVPSVNFIIELYGLITTLSQILPQDLFQEALEDSKRIVIDNKILEQTENGMVYNYTILIIIAKKRC